jgi:heterodisulfide reductase subunit B
LKNDSAIRAQVNDHLIKIGKEYKGTIEVRHIIEFLDKEIGKEKIDQLIERPLELRVAVHYGCHLLKPTKERKLGGAEYPLFFDGLVEATGAISASRMKEKTAAVALAVGCGLQCLKRLLK